MCDDINLENVSGHGMCGSIQIDSSYYIIINTSNYYENVYASFYTIFSDGYNYKESECLIDSNGTTDMSGIIGFITTDNRLFVSYTHRKDEGGVISHYICYAFLSFTNHELVLDKFEETSIKANLGTFTKCEYLGDNHYLSVVKSNTGDYTQLCSITLDLTNNTASFDLSTISTTNSYGDSVCLEKINNNKYLVLSGNDNYKLTAFIVDISDTYVPSVTLTKQLSDEEYSGSRILSINMCYGDAESNDFIILHSYGLLGYPSGNNNARLGEIIIDSTGDVQYLYNSNYDGEIIFNKYGNTAIQFDLNTFVILSSDRYYIYRVSFTDNLSINLEYKDSGYYISHNDLTYTPSPGIKCVVGIYDVVTTVHTLIRGHLVIPVQIYLTNNITCPIYLTILNLNGYGVVKSYDYTHVISLSQISETKPGRVCLLKRLEPA